MFFEKDIRTSGAQAARSRRGRKRRRLARSNIGAFARWKQAGQSNRVEAQSQTPLILHAPLPRKQEEGLVIPSGIYYIFPSIILRDGIDKR
jgi:hypothetical protein